MKCRIALIAVMATALAGHAVAAITEGQTPAGLTFVIGGIGTEEVDALKVRQSNYSLKLIMASQQDGAYLADTHVRITGPAGVILDVVMPAPWLMIDVPPGRYQVVASHRDQTQRREITASRGAPAVVLTFKVADLDALGSMATTLPPR